MNHCSFASVQGIADKNLKSESGFGADFVAKQNKICDKTIIEIYSDKRTDLFPNQIQFVKFICNLPII